MWMPTHVQVTVQRAAGLLTKGKNKTNDCFVTIALGKTKYQTSIKEKADPDVEWHEECELPIPDQGNTAEIILTALHHNGFGVDEFLGRVAIPLNTLDIYERPKNKWYGLEAKPGKVGKAKERGHLEVKIGFTVKSGSLTDLSKKEKHKSSIGQLSHVAQSVGGSLLSLGSAEKRKGIKKFAKSIGSKMHLRGKKKDGDLDDSSSIGSVGSLKRNFDKFKSRQTKEDADPGVVSDEDDFTFDDLSHKSSVSSLNHPTNHNNSVSSTENISGDVSNKTPPAKPPRNEPKPQDEWESKLFGKQTKNLLKPASSESLNRRSWDSSKLDTQIEEEPPETTVTKDDISVTPTKTPEVVKKEERDGMLAKLKNFRKDKHEIDSKRDKPTSNSSERIIIGGEKDVNYSYNNHISNELLQKFEGKSREDLILLVCNLQSDLESQKKKLKDLEDYLDDLLLRVMETTPRILQNPYVTLVKY
ncbi:rab11 family-interacting protein 1 isoform X2 [Tribolium castaneum]|uniref:rab11 family-interacting protein 1 isoform X2 n=1 Tax=Tribolium castaneum TaxID=7070 RepID=UPI0001DCC344|nr:PREDICTED: rab11 family-interacting protein 1 isoform X2 [Tribolium castaneum]|eukprot:XP_008193422.1 PREDICTED: rab11 family-interacting protein 1 isoform X2 [Tribolium castaneum]